MKFLHELKDAEELYDAVANEKEIEPYLVEKDYWIMHALWGLQKQGFDFELKGGTSLSKAYKIIDRFSEDIDIKIKPASDKTLPVGINHTKDTHITKRREYFEELAKVINIPGMQVSRDTDYDDPKFRNAGILLSYDNILKALPGVKEGILLEVGFDTTTPNEAIDIDSWAFNKAIEVHSDLMNTKAISVKCYLPEYTFVEKLQTITRKARQQKENGKFDINFLRHFYDIHQLFQQQRVKNFIGSDEYIAHKEARFRGADNPILEVNLAFNLDKEPALFEEYKRQYQGIESLFIGSFPLFDEIYQSVLNIRSIG